MVARASGRPFRLLEIIEMLRFRRHAVAIVALLLAAPSLARAQYMPHAKNKLPEPLPVLPVSPAQVVLDKGKDFALTDSQRVELGLIQRQLDAANAPLIARLDSLRPTYRPAGGFADLSPEQREDIDSRRKAMTAVLALMEPNFATARQRTVALLAPKLHGKLAKVENDARKKAWEQARRDMEAQSRFDPPPRRRGGMGNGYGRITTN
jgi:hypothetical protein